MTYQSSVFLRGFFLFPASIHASLAVTWAHEFRPKWSKEIGSASNLNPTGPLVTSFAHHQARNIDSVKRWVWMVGLLFLAVDEISNGKLQSRSSSKGAWEMNQSTGRGEHEPKAVSFGNQNQATRSGAPLSTWPRAPTQWGSQTWDPSYLWAVSHHSTMLQPRPMSWSAGSKCLTILQCGKVLMAGRVGLEDKNISRLTCTASSSIRTSLSNIPPL